MKKVLAAVTLLAMVVGAQNTKHVFWYKVVTNNYDIAYNEAGDIGPNIQGEVVKHQGKALTSTVRGSAGNQDPIITLGNGLDNAQARCFVIWYKDLCEKKLTEGATLASAKFRAEYRDNWSGNAFCNAGPLNPRVGVLNIQGHLDALGVTPAQHPDNAVWQDPINPLTGTMGYEMAGEDFRAQENKSMTAPAGTLGENAVRPLEGKFWEIDITTQVNYILANPGQLGVAAVLNAGDGSTGKVNLYAMEDCVIAGQTSDPWTQDGNTAHIVLEITGGTLEPKTAVESLVSSSSEVALSSNPNPCNPVTTVSYNTGVAKNGVVKIFNAEGKLVHSTTVTGNGSFVWNGKNLTSGIYVCRLEAGKAVVSRNIILMK